MTRLLDIPDREVERLAGELRAGRRPALPGAVRASIGLGTTPHDIDRLIDALHEVAATGPRSRYQHMTDLDEYLPEPRGTPEPASGGESRRDAANSGALPRRLFGRLYPGAGRRSQPV
jgi:hypothetical protein